ncbi:AraC family transcriptional regulator [Bauldia litoralis]|uniref:AraC family transcriptional regulator n=1 Tax=Bauldia litoralis TaxID=665467 RepID=UPI003263CD34
MRPLFEKVTVPEGVSWALLDRRLDEGIPFQWHYHPEFELTLTLNSRGQRYVGDSIASYDDGDLALLGPNLPHTWCSAERIDPAHPHHAVVMWFTEDWASAITGSLAEMHGVRPLLAEAGRGVVFSREAAETARPIIATIPDRPPADRLLRLMEVLALLATDDARRPIAGPGSDRQAVASPDQPRIERVLDHLHAHYREPVSVAALAEVAALSPSGFHRLFRRHTRLTVTAYVAQLRIGQACALLVNTSQPIAHVAEAVGYANLANFNRQFRATKGMTPRDFRRSFARQQVG